MRYFLILMLVGLFSCQTSKNAPSTESLEDHGSDPEFQSKHERPASISFHPQGVIKMIPVKGQAEARSYQLNTSDSNKYLFVFHEWWGMNDQIKMEADRLYSQLMNEVNVWALDLYDGEVTDEADEASTIMRSRDSDRLRSIVKAAIDATGDDAEIGTIGWCFGGGWSLRTGFFTGKKNAGNVMYYGMVPLEELDELGRMDKTVLGIFAMEDKHITPEYARSLQKYLTEKDHGMSLHFYEADHAFANPSSPRYNEAESSKANAMALQYLQTVFEVN